MKKYLMEFLILVMAIGLLFEGAGTAAAQGAASDEGTEFTLEEITVTAEKREQTVQSVARSLAVITGDDLTMRQATNVQDMLTATAGVSFQGFFNQIAIRGVGIGGAQANDPGYEPSVQFNVDGNLALHTAGGTSTMFQALMDVERIEVLRGPSGAINGRMAAAGSINVVTKDPDFEKIDFNGGITYGNYNTLNMNAAMNLPLKLTGLDLPGTLENLSFRVAFTKNKHSAFIHNEDDEDVSGSQDASMVRIKMKWQPLESLVLNGLYTYSKDKSNSSMNVPPIDTQQTFPPGQPGPHPDDPWLYEGAAAESEPQARKNFSRSIETILSTSFANFTAKWSQSWTPVECQDTVGTGAAPAAASFRGVGGNLVAFQGPPPPGGGGICYEGNIGQKDLEVRIASSNESKYTWMVGAYKYYKKEYAGPDTEINEIDPNDVNINFTDFYGRGEYFLPFDVTSSDFPANDPNRPWVVPGLSPVTPDSVYFLSNDATRPIDSYSYFGNITVPLFEDKHRFTFGLRKSVEKKKRAAVYGIFKFDDTFGGMPHFTFVQNNFNEKGNWYCDNCYLEYTEPPHVMETSSKPVNITAGWEFDFKPDVMMYANINNGFKPGGISSESVPNVYYEPETVTTYAVGVKSRLFGNRLQLNAEVFLMDYKNLQLDMNSQAEVSFTAANGVTYTQAYMFNKVIVNVGRTINKGLTVDYEWLITNKDRLSGNFEFKDNKYGKMVYHLGTKAMPPGAPEWFSLEGRQMPFAPKFSFYSSYRHLFSFSNYTLTPRFDIHYSTKYPLYSEYYWENAGVETVQSAYFKYDGYVNFGPTSGTWELNAYVKNLSNEVVRNLGMMYTAIQEPRTIGMGITARF